MLKLINCVIVLLILCSALHSSLGGKFNCQFEVETLPYVGNVYYCSVTSLDNSLNSMTIDGFTGFHAANRNDNDVNGIFIHSTNIKFIPANLGFSFHLSALIIKDTDLIEINVENFQRMENLEFLNLAHNKLTSVPTDAFSTMTKLKLIWLEGNQIKYMGSGLFDELISLRDVDLSGNICVNKRTSDIIQLKRDIKSNCYKPNDVIQYEIENKFINEMKVMKAERQQEHYVITNHQVSLNKDKDAWKVDKDALLKDKETLVKDKEALVKDKDACKVDKEALVKDKEALVKDKAALVKDNETLVKDKEALVKDKDACKVDKEALVKDKDTCKVDKEALVKEKDAWMVNNEALVKDKDDIKVLRTDFLQVKDDNHKEFKALNEKINMLLKLIEERKY